MPRKLQVVGGQGSIIGLGELVSNRSAGKVITTRPELKWYSQYLSIGERENPITIVRDVKIILGILVCTIIPIANSDMSSNLGRRSRRKKMFVNFYSYLTTEVKKKEEKYTSEQSNHKE